MSFYTVHTIKYYPAIYEAIFVIQFHILIYLLQPSKNSALVDSVIALMPNVLKVFLENGQTKSFKYDYSTTIQVPFSMFRYFILTKVLNLYKTEMVCYHYISIAHNRN